MSTLTVPQASFKYRMGAAIPGDVNRTHPASVEPNYNDATNPVLQAGLACVVNSAKNGVRGMASGDTGVTTIYGVAVRAYPLQQPTGDASFGAQAFGLENLAAGAAIDVIRDGYVMVQIPSSQTPGKGDACFIWVAASGSGHVQGGFENATSAGNTASITNAVFNGPPDANGYVEILIRNNA